MISPVAIPFLTSVRLISRSCIRSKQCFVQIILESAHKVWYVVKFIFSHPLLLAYIVSWEEGIPKSSLACLFVKPRSMRKSPIFSWIFPGNSAISINSLSFILVVSLKEVNLYYYKSAISIVSIFRKFRETGISFGIQTVLE